MTTDAEPIKLYLKANIEKYQILEDDEFDVANPEEYFEEEKPAVYKCNLFVSSPSI